MHFPCFTMKNTAFSNVTTVTKLFQPLNVKPANGIDKSYLVSKGYKNMINGGIIRPVSKGMYALLPLGLRIIDKMTALIDREMQAIGAQKILLPALTATDLWRTTDRYESGKTELFKLEDRHKKAYILSPTFEESICNLISDIGYVPVKQLPLKLYQISSKWRDEMKPRLGLLRSREFIMKDLYTFDENVEKAQNTYNLVCEAYNRIFKQIDLDFIKAVGDVGMIGGSMSHEYHYFSEIGEDIVMNCYTCNFYINKTILDKPNCPQCGNSLSEHITTEVGHAFLLNTKYSKPFNVLSLKETTTEPLVMGCFGIGVSRIIAAAAEILSINDELRWPVNIAPYTVCIVPPKKGSKEENAVYYIEQIYNLLSDLSIDVLIDDRTQFTIGKRMLYARATGIPYVIVIGKSAVTKSLFEIHDVYNDKYHEVRLEGIHDYFKTNINAEKQNKT